MLRNRYVFASIIIVALSLGACGPATPLPGSPPTTAVAVPTATTVAAAATAEAPTPMAMVAAAAATATPPATPVTEVSPAEPDTMTLQSFDFTSKALAANLLGEMATRRTSILLPPGYATGSRRYPVLFVLHAYGGNNYTMLTTLQRSWEQAHRAGKARDMIMVFPDASNRLGGSYYLDSPTTGGFETYIVQELVNYIDTNFRTLPRREGRGITGCSMGGEGAAHLGLAHPDVFSIVAAVSAIYNWGEPGWQEMGAGLKGPPKAMTDFARIPFWAQVGIAQAAAGAPNPDNPPFYLDWPWAFSGSDVQVVETVVDRIANLDPSHDARRYVKQPQRLAAFLIYHGRNDATAPITEARTYDRLLTDLGINHTLVEDNSSGHCDIDYVPVVQFLSEHLVFEAP